MTTRTRILTGITTTGTPHLGNYAGAIRPAILASRDSNADSFYFLADYHALIKCDDPLRIQRSRLEIAATWLAGGLDVDRVTFYRQSDIPEIPELTWLLTCVAAKGLLNRAHAYKASVDKNVEAGEDPDAGITMGLYSYPVLMAADILMFNAHKVPVGRDQIQHVEMARDIGQRFNHLFGQGKEFFTMPEALIEESVATLPGLDGRKMSKSYDNTIPLFSSAKDMKDAISRIVTDSRAPGEAKDPDNSHLFTLFQAFATAEQSAEFRSELLQGLGWGEAKNRLFQLLDSELGEARERYHQFIERPSDLEDILQLGAKKPGPWRRRSSTNCARPLACVRLSARSRWPPAPRKSRQGSTLRQLPRRRRQFPLPSTGRRRRATVAVEQFCRRQDRRAGDQAIAVRPALGLTQRRPEFQRLARRRVRGEQPGLRQQRRPGCSHRCVARCPDACPGLIRARHPTIGPNKGRLPFLWAVATVTARFCCLANEYDAPRTISS